MAHSIPEHVVVILGAGGIGLAAARRLACGRKIILGSRSHKSLNEAKETLELDGHRVETIQVDVTHLGSVETFAKQAAAAGTLDIIVHTSGVSPVQVDFDGEAVIQINLIGTAHVLDAFLPYVGPTTSLIVVSSIAAHILPMFQTLPPALEKHFATAQTSDLLSHPDYSPSASQNAGAAYCISKKANNLRVQGLAKAYGAKGARINSVSPAVIMTKMGWAQVKTDQEGVDRMKAASALDRHASPDDIVSAIAFLASREASFVTGTDMLLDGGALAGMFYGGSEASEKIMEMGKAREGEANGTS